MYAYQTEIRHFLKEKAIHLRLYETTASLEEARQTKVPGRSRQDSRKLQVPLQYCIVNTRQDNSNSARYTSSSAAFAYLIGRINPLFGISRAGEVRVCHENIEIRNVTEGLSVEEPSGPTKFIVPSIQRFELLSHELASERSPDTSVYAQALITRDGDCSP